jgi:hypothetical protein
MPGFGGVAIQGYKEGCFDKEPPSLAVFYVNKS